MTRLMLADVDAGSDTPSLVGKVLKWRKAECVKGRSSYPGVGQNQSSPIIDIGPYS
jgi:phosphomevalonate kinase